MKFKLFSNKNWKDRLLTAAMFFAPIIFMVLVLCYILSTVSRKYPELHSDNIENARSMELLRARYDIISDTIVNYNMIPSAFPQIKDVFIECAWGYADYWSYRKKIFSYSEYSIILSFKDFKDWSTYEKRDIEVISEYDMVGFPPTFYSKKYITEIPDTLHFTIKCEKFEEHITCKKAVLL